MTRPPATANAPAATPTYPARPVGIAPPDEVAEAADPDADEADAPTAPVTEDNDGWVTEDARRARLEEVAGALDWIEEMDAPTPEVVEAMAALMEEREAAMAPETEDTSSEADEADALALGCKSDNSSLFACRCRNRWWGWRLTRDQRNLHRSNH